MRARAGADRGVRKWEAACFAAGWLFLVVALVSPLDALGGILFSAHMAQHEVLMLVAAPLLVLGRPLAVFLWLSALEDQQLAGLIMWIPAGVVFILLGLGLFAAWMGEAESRVAHTRSERLLRERNAHGA